jgi:hypothetical protein
MEVVFKTPEGAAAQPVIPEIKTEPTTVNEPVVVEPVISETTKVEPVIAEPTTVEIQEHLKKIKELTGREFKSDDEVKTFFEDYEKVKTEFTSIKEKDDYYKELENEIIEKGKEYDPVAKFGGKDNYKKAVIIQELAKNGDEGIAKKFVLSDRTKMDAIETLSLFAQYQDESLVGDTETATRTALRQLGIQVDRTMDLQEALEGLEKEDRSIINIRAKEIKGIIDKAIEAVPEPDMKDPLKDIFNKVEQTKAKTQEYNTKWSQTKNQVLGSLDTIEFENSDFKFQINKEGLEKVVDDFLNGASRKAIEPDEAGKARVVKAIKDHLFMENRKKIMEAKESHDKLKWKEEYDKKHTNASPLTVNQPPPVDDKRNKFMASVYEATGVKQ